MAVLGKPCGNSVCDFLCVHFVCCLVLLLLRGAADPLVDGASRIEQCPGECKCLDKGSIMTCRHGNIHHVPYLLGTTMFLDLDDNRLGILQNDSIVNVPRLEVLSVQMNDMRQVQAGAFLLVPELRILRLGNNKLNALPNDVFWNNRHLEVLDVHGNYFTEVPDTIMYHLHSLQLLNMSYNQITSPYLGPGFKYTTQLRGLDLTRNNLISLESNVFQSTLWWDETIRHSLNLSYCNIHHIHPYAFGKLYRLQVLSLEGNPFIKEEDLKGALADLEVSTLTSLNLSWMNITDAYDFFQRFQHRRLIDLKLAHNNIDTIRQGTFFYLINLQSLDLSFNSISEIGDLNSLAKLEYLSLAFNTIAEIEITTFEGLHNLKELDLSHNSLSMLTDAPFQALFYLNTLRLSCNLISHMEITTGLEHLEHLDISSNRLLNIRFVEHLPRLTSLDASDNSLMHISTGLFSTALTYLNFSSNMISVIDSAAFTESSQDVMDLSYNRIEHIAHFGWSSVRKLYLTGNRIFNITPSAFEGLSNLDELSLASNRIIWIPSVLFLNLDIRKLDISNNPLHPSCIGPSIAELGNSLQLLKLVDIHLKILPSAILQNLTSLSVLDLSYNRLRIITQHSLPSLRLLNLSHNAFISPDPASFGKIHSVDLSHNPFDCTCHLMPFRYWLLSTNISHRTHIIHSTTYMCHSPPEWINVPVRDFYVEGASCNPHEKAVIFTAVGCTLIAVLLTLVIAVYRFKCCQVGKFDSTRYSAIDDRLDQIQQEQRLVSCDVSSSSPATASEIQPASLISQPWL